MNPAPDDARESLNAHVAAKGEEIYLKYGPRLGWTELLQLLNDRTCVRYPCAIMFSAGDLQAGEFAHAAPRGSSPEDGYTIYVHPHFERQLEKVPFLVLYQLVLVNYGAFATADDAETFGAKALGLEKDTYYQTLCGFADEINEL